MSSAAYINWTLGTVLGFVFLANMILKRQGKSYWAGKQKQERYRVRRMTFLLFQLFLAIFAAYAVMYSVPNENLLVPLTCLITMFLLGKHPQPRREITIGRMERLLLSSMTHI
jgi:membrane protein insertase Oxa1/YidC/SpoIIIJ